MTRNEIIAYWVESSKTNHNSMTNMFANSDIDLALVTDSFVGDVFDFCFLLTKLARSIDPDIEPHPYLISEFNENNPMAVEILRNGLRVV